MTQYYVSPTGNNANAGTTTATAKATIAGAHAVVVAGDYVDVLAGTYSVSAASSSTAGILTNKNGSAGAKITWRSSPGRAAKIVGKGAGYVWQADGAYNIFDGFDISGPPTRIGMVVQGDNCVVRYNYIHDISAPAAVGNGSGGGGIVCYGDHCDIWNNFVNNIDSNNAAANHVQGIYIAATFPYVYNNVVANCGGLGVHQWHGASDAKVINNTIFSCAAGGIIIGSGDSGQLTAGSTNNFIENNIVYDNGGIGINQLGRTSSNTYRNNCCFQNVGGNFNFSASSGTTIASTISASPVFVNYLANGTGDYHVQSTSPCRNASTATYAPAFDHFSVTRPQETNATVGAIEYIP